MYGNFVATLVALKIAFFPIAASVEHKSTATKCCDTSGGVIPKQRLARLVLQRLNKIARHVGIKIALRNRCTQYNLFSQLWLFWLEIIKSPLVVLSNSNNLCFPFVQQEEVKAWTSAAVLPIVKSPSRASPSKQTKRTP